LQKALAGTTDFDPIFRIILADGQIRFIQAAAIISFDDEGNPREVLGINRDITEQREYEKNLRKAKQNADDANLAKSEFLANMSHEIRTPMNGVLGITELLGNTALDNRQQESIALIRNSASILLNIIHDILDISKIEAGKIELEMLPFSLDQKIGKLMKGFAPTAHGKNLEIHYYIDPKVPTWIVGDPGRVGQVLFNLVSNALKFTETGEVKLEVSLDEASQSQPSDRQAGSAPVYLRFDLTDTGIGIPVEKQKAVFEAFTQADNTTTRRFGGTGLGLKIVAELVQLMGGEIHLHSEVNQGSTFSVKLPFGIGQADSAEMLDESPWQKDPSQLQGKRCLVVDDNAINRRWLKDTLESWHCIVRVADSVTAAIDILKASADSQSPIDLLVLDKNMPELDGFQLMEMLNHQHISRPETILMLSSSDGSDDYERCKKLGIEKYIVKPVRQDEIYNAIASSIYANLNHAGQVTAETPRIDQPQRCATPLRILLAEDNPINQRLVLDILEDRGHKITMVENGRQAVQQALAQYFDVILMDVQMPEMDGLAATRAIRSQQQPPHRQIPIIGLTANALKGDRALCLNAGMDDYLTKPVNLKLLITTVEAYGNSQANSMDMSSHQNLQARQELPPKQAMETKAFDLEQSLSRMQNKTALIVKTAQLLLAKNTESIQKLEEALTNKNKDELVILAHTLKGANGNLCSQWLLDKLGELEALARDNDFDAFRQKWPTAKGDIKQFEAELQAFLDSQ
jgi:signal transduction histidine kinase/DNA-binding response OmpR family regulator